MTVDLGDAGSILAVVIAGIALWFTARSTSVSERSATTSATSAEAAQEAVRLTRAAHRDAQRPIFKMTAEAPENGTCHVTVRMVKGPPEILVSAEYTATVYLPDEAGRLLPAQHLDSPWSFDCGLVKNDWFTLVVDGLPPATNTVSIRVILLCEDEAEDRQWHHVEIVEWPPQVNLDAKAHARLVTIEVDHSSTHYGSGVMSVTITNHSEQPVHRPQVESMGDARPPVRWGWDQVHLVDEDGNEYVLRTDEMLLPHMSTRVPYQHVDADDRPIIYNFFNDTIKEYVHGNDVTITFEMSGVRWRRSGNGEPVRVVQLTPGTE